MRSPLSFSNPPQYRRSRLDAQVESRTFWQLSFGDSTPLSSATKHGADIPSMGDGGQFDGHAKDQLYRDGIFDQDESSAYKRPFLNKRYCHSGVRTRWKSAAKAPCDCDTKRGSHQRREM
jgi:hypothetical protein